MLQYHEIAQEYIGKHGRNFILLVNILALGSLAVVQIIACASDIHIMAPDLDKRNWALVFGVSRLVKCLQHGAPPYCMRCVKTPCSVLLFVSPWPVDCACCLPSLHVPRRHEACSSQPDPVDSNVAALPAQSMSGADACLASHSHSSGHLGLTFEAALQAITLLTCALPTLHNFRIWSFMGLLATTYTTWFLVGSAINHGPVSCWLPTLLCLALGASSLAAPADLHLAAAC